MVVVDSFKQTNPMFPLKPP